jgi:hypothetical protein
MVRVVRVSETSVMSHLGVAGARIPRASHFPEMACTRVTNGDEGGDCDLVLCVKHVFHQSVFSHTTEHTRPLQAA